MYTHRDTSAPPAGISSVPAARPAFLLLRTAFTAAPVNDVALRDFGLRVSAPAHARLATGSDHHGRRVRAS
jgi:hypothetical protein